MDHHHSIYSFKQKKAAVEAVEDLELSKEALMDLARAGDVRSQFSGKIVEISVDEGQEVMIGDRVAIMEAMKMQTPILCEMNGIVTAIFAKKGDDLKPGSKILKIDTDE